MDDIRKGTCPLCRHNEIIEAAAMDLSPRARAPHGAIVAYAGAVTVKFKGDGSFVSHGVIQHYVCRRCGYLQSFAGSPAEIPIGHDYHTRVIRGAASDDGPYR